MKKEIFKQLEERVKILEKALNGGKGSGNFGHSGRPGEVGGSAPDGGTMLYGAKAYKAIGDSHKKAKEQDEKIREKDSRALIQEVKKLIETSQDAHDRGSELLTITATLESLPANLKSAKEAEGRLKTASKDDKWMDRARTLSRMQRTSEAIRFCDHMLKKDKGLGDRTRTLVESMRDELKAGYDSLQKVWDKLDADSQKQKNHFDRVERPEKLVNGGPGSGNFGHVGRPGKVGGSGKGTVSAESSNEKIDKEATRKLQEELERLGDSFRQSPGMQVLIEKDETGEVKDSSTEKTGLEKHIYERKQAKVDRIKEKVGKDISITADDLADDPYKDHSYTTTFEDSDGQEYSYDVISEKVIKRGSGEEMLSPSEKKANEDKSDLWKKPSWEIKGTEIKKKLKEYGINTEGLSVRRQDAGYSDAWYVEGSGKKTDLRSVERILKDKLESYERDVSGEILMGGNTFVFVTDTDRDYRSSVATSTRVVKNEIDLLNEKLDYLERLLNGGPGSGNFGHAGRPGKVGGSGKSGSTLASKDSGKGRPDGPDVTQHMANTAEENIDMATKQEPATTKALANAFKKNGAAFEGYKYRIKTKSSLADKFSRDLKEKNLPATNENIQKVAGEIHDNLRYTALVEEGSFKKQYDGIIKDLSSNGYELVKVKNSFPNKDAGYRGLNTIVRNKNGYLFELQFHTRQSADVKKKNHIDYNVARDVKTPAKEKARLEKIMAKRAKSIRMPAGVEEIENFNKIKS